MTYQNARTYRERQRQKGLCRACPNKLAPTSISLCEKHLLQDRERALARLRLRQQKKGSRR